MLRRLIRPLWLLLAAAFLFEAWLWDKLTLLGHWLQDHLPFEALKRWISERVAALPPWAALLLFVIPVILVQPLKLLALWLIFHGHVLLGALAFVAVKITGFGAIAFLFDLTRDKLLSLHWFAWLHTHVLWLRDKASAFIAPYKLALKARMATLRASLLGRRSLLARLRSRSKH